MASNHKHPEADIAWFLVGDKLAIVTTRVQTQVAFILGRETGKELTKLSQTGF